MIFLSRVLKDRVNRWVNTATAAITIVFVVGAEVWPFTMCSLRRRKACVWWPLSIRCGGGLTPGKCPSNSQSHAAAQEWELQMATGGQHHEGGGPKRVWLTGCAWNEGDRQAGRQ
jgi:hypothetical protein